jgi:hypothetical protein
LSHRLCLGGYRCDDQEAGHLSPWSDFETLVAEVGR